MSRSYFGKLDEESVKNNFVLIYELLDGWLLTRLGFLYLMSLRNPGFWISPKFRDRYAENVYHNREHQIRDGSGASTLILQSRTDPVTRTQREDSSKITIQATGATSWRRSDVKYRKNEAFVDVIETVNLLMSKEGWLS